MRAKASSSHRLGRLAVLVLGALGLAPIGVGACGQPEPRDEQVDASTGDAPLPPAPDIIDPADDDIEITSDRLEQLRLRIADVVLGLTSVIIDGKEFAPRDEPTAMRIDVERLRIPLGGALVVGRHMLQLSTPHALGALRSRVVQVRIAPGKPLSVTLTPRGSNGEGGVALVRFGEDETASLLRLRTDADGRRVADVFTSSDGAFSTTAAATIALAGHVFDDTTAHAPEVTATWIAPGRLWLAWTVGAAREHITAADVRIVPGAADGVSVTWQGTVLTKPEGHFEYARYGRLLWLDRTLIAERMVAHDVEVPHPGDRHLVSVTYGEQLSSGGALDVLDVDPLADLDALGPVLDAARWDGTAGLYAVVRRNRTVPMLLRLDPRGATLRVEGELAPDQDTLARMASVPTGVLGGFGSLSIVARDDDHQPLVVQGDLWSERELHDRSPTLVASAPLSGAPAVGVVNGQVAALVPRGDDEAALVLLNDGQQTSIKPLSPLRCQTVALAWHRPGNRRGRLTIACLGASALRFFELGTQAADP